MLKIAISLVTSKPKVFILPALFKSILSYLPSAKTTMAP
ncbi:hypothetical protein PALB_20310 [Pseudoalteromonas luteoviolacea B = ATCC 29581]|nr:hypothetical protein PALB_20310 [Pseudoalteromonas luteoviolacea B = ATCC 29581]